MADTKDKAQPFLDHLLELRRSLIHSLIALGVISLGCGLFAREIYTILTKPLQEVLPPGSHFITTTPVEAWTTYLKVSLFSGLFLSSPVLFYYLWRFIAPGLYKKEKKYILLFVFSASFFFVGGAVFGYFFAFPLAFQYLVGLLENTGISFLPQMKDAFSLISHLMIGFGVIFELPIVVFFLSASGLVSIKSLMKFQKYLIVLALIVGAILTPPDVISQLLMAIPLVILYQVGLLAAWLVKKE